MQFTYNAVQPFVLGTKSVYCAHSRRPLVPDFLPIHHLRWCAYNYQCSEKTSATLLVTPAMHSIDRCKPIPQFIATAQTTQCQQCGHSIQGTRAIADTITPHQLTVHSASSPIATLLSPPTRVFCRSSPMPSQLCGT